MFIVSTVRHITLFEQMTDDERNHIFYIVNKVIAILRNNNIAKEFNVIFEEKKNIHFHIWILPRDGWKEKGINPTRDIGRLEKYSLENMRTKENLEAIIEINELVKKEMRG